MLENVKMILDMNANGKKPVDITELVEVEEKAGAEEVLEFADVVGHITLASLDKKDKKHFHKNKPQNRQQGSNQGNRPAQNSQQQIQRNPQKQNRPPGRNDGNRSNQPNRNNPPDKS